ncbi:LuxR C-terminal-related transcriptional regulator [Lentzea sp. NPDC042327]|uniref:helix-turn-helix transcriptional regulator n=1 Tax=Lentzea sp. NPDC042327 TaxID=3154801 RepID=UPI0034116BE5
MSGNRDGLFRGREGERALLDGVLAEGTGVALVDGAAGTGKTRLLTETARTAERRGFTVVTARDELDQPFLLARLAERDPGGPTLVVLDDLHLAEPGTLAALRALLPNSVQQQVVWLLARRCGEGADRLFAALARTAAHVELRPLPDDVAAQFVADLAGGVPDHDLCALAATAQGNPAALIRLVTALRDDDQLVVTEERAALRTDGSPRRTEALLRERITALSGGARHLLQVASVFGPRFEPGDVAELLASSTAVLVPALDEVIGAGLVTAAEDRLAFRHELVWRLVADSVPAPVRRALHREAGEMLLGRGDAAATAARHLLHGARRGDVRSIDGLVTAAKAVLWQAPDASAELAVRALELTDQTSPSLPNRTVTAVRALVAAGRLTAAHALAEDSVAGQVPSPSAAKLRHCVAVTTLLGARCAESVELADVLLTETDLPAELVPWVEITRLMALLGHDRHRAQEVADAVVRSRRGAPDDVLATALAVLAALARDSGRPGTALELARAGARAVSSHDLCAYPQLLLATLHAGLREFGEAEGLLRRVRGGPSSVVTRELLTAVVHARVLLQAGRIEEAASEAHTALAAAEDTGHTVLLAPALVVLALVALHTGDLPAAVEHVERYRGTGQVDGIVFSHGFYQWADVLVTYVHRGLEPALGLLHGRYPDLVESGLFAEEPRAAGWFVRRAAEAGDDGLAKAVVDRVERLAEENPGFRAVAATALHVRGLLDGDTALLRLASEQHRDPWARANAAEDLGAVLAATPDRAASVKALETALGLYREIGASRDGARVLGRLRKLGRRRRAAPVRPSSGWSSLDDTERAIANLVAKGRTNRQISTQLFMSPHTVNFHLRKIFRKLGISSRVELVLRSRDED